MGPILVLTDLHYTPDVPTEGPDPDARLAACLAHAAHCVPEAALLVLCGDLADKGDTASYKRLKARLADAHVPVRLMIGNHDHRENFASVFGADVLDDLGFVQGVQDTGDTRLIFLDTLFAPPYDYPATHCGWLCETRMDWLDRQLAEAPGRVVIFMHHPPHDVGFRAMDYLKLRNGAAFHDMIARHGNVAQIICGHIHRTISGTHRGTPFSVFKSPMMQMPLDFHTLNFEAECDDPPAFGIVLLTPDAVLVHSEDVPL